MSDTLWLAEPYVRLGCENIQQEHKETRSSLSAPVMSESRPLFSHNAFLFQFTLSGKQQSGFVLSVYSLPPGELSVKMWVMEEGKIEQRERKTKITSCLCAHASEWVLCFCVKEKKERNTDLCAYHLASSPASQFSLVPSVHKPSEKPLDSKGKLKQKFWMQHHKSGLRLDLFTRLNLICLTARRL